MTQPGLRDGAVVEFGGGLQVVVDMRHRCMLLQWRQLLPASTHCGGFRLRPFEIGPRGHIQTCTRIALLKQKYRTHGILYGFNSTLFIVLTSNFLHDPLFVVISE